MLVVILVFSLAIALGLYMIYIGLRFHRGSLALGLGHASFATLGLVLLVVHIIRSPVRQILYSDAAILFVMTLIGGLVLLALREGRKPPSMIVVAMHAAIALFAMWLLILGYIRT